MPGTPTARLALPRIIGADTPVVPRDHNALADRLEAVVALFDHGLLADLPTSSPGSPGIVDRYYWVTDFSALLRDNGIGWEWVTWPRVLLTALPAGPVDGQEITYQAEVGVNWRFRYNASGGTYKWEFVGGPALLKEVATQEDHSGPPTTYSDLTTVGPDVTVPLAGIFDVTPGAVMLPRDTSATRYMAMSYAIGATAASDLDGIQGNSNAGMPWGVAASRTRRKTFASSGVLLRAKYKGDEARFVARTLSILPVRVG